MTGFGGTWIVGETLRKRAGGCGEPKGAGQQQAESDGNRVCATAAHDSSLPQRERSSAEGGNHSHYPSSKYNKAKKPVRPPTHTGSHAEAIGCINSALLKSSVTLDKT